MCDGRFNQVGIRIFKSYNGFEEKQLKNLRPHINIYLIVQKIKDEKTFKYKYVYNSIKCCKVQLNVILKSKFLARVFHYLTRNQT